MAIVFSKTHFPQSKQLTTMNRVFLLVAILGTFLSYSVINAVDTTETCDADGVCTDTNPATAAAPTKLDVEIGVSRYANAEGKPAEAVEDCFDRHDKCKQFASQGECENNPGWMIIHCSVSCDACHLRTLAARCGRENLNTTDTGFLVPGKLNQMFERVDKELRGRYKVNILSHDPWIMTIDDFMTAEETEAIITATGKNWERSTDTGQTNKYGETGRKLSSSRTSSNAWCRADCEANPLVKSVINKIVDVTTIPYENYESFQVLQYELGQYYRAHHDTGPSQMSLTCGQRILTFFLYLSDVEEGGETSFPKLNLAVKPKRGKAVFWPGVMNDSPTTIDHRTLHEAKPVIKGVKYAANSCKSSVVILPCLVLYIHVTPCDAMRYVVL